MVPTPTSSINIILDVTRETAARECYLVLNLDPNSSRSIYNILHGFPFPVIEDSFFELLKLLLIWKYCVSLLMTYTYQEFL